MVRSQNRFGSKDLRASDGEKARSIAGWKESGMTRRRERSKTEKNDSIQHTQSKVDLRPNNQGQALTRVSDLSSRRTWSGRLKAAMRRMIGRNRIIRAHDKPPEVSEAKSMMNTSVRVQLRAEGVAFDRQDYIDHFLDWLAERGYTGQLDRWVIESRAQEFNERMKIRALNPDSLFKGLKAAGVTNRLVDLPPTDPRFLDAKRHGVVRPRGRMYRLPPTQPHVSADEVRKFSRAHRM